MNKKPKKALVRKKRKIVAYSEFWHTANMLIEAGEEKPSGSEHQFRAALIFQAFTFEAALNHIGQLKFGCWNTVEKSLSPEKKLALISEKLSIHPDFGKPPWQILSQLLRYRNAIAHGKTKMLEESYEKEVREYLDDQYFKFTKSDWEKFATRENALKVKKDLMIAVKQLLNACGIADEIPFMMGQQEGSLSMIE